MYATKLESDSAANYQSKNAKKKNQSTGVVALDPADFIRPKVWKFDCVLPVVSGLHVRTPHSFEKIKRCEKKCAFFPFS
jgi:hypothetical protein